tara:strand:+ start:45 stop:494 length:450 start_codon:yes stop_codon:yes gene_type:complete
MTKKEIFKKLKKEYLDRMSTASYIKYRSTTYGTSEKERKARGERALYWEVRALEIIDMMKLMEIPQKWIKEFNDSRLSLTWEAKQYNNKFEWETILENETSIPNSAREMWIYEKYVQGYTKEKIFDDYGNFIKRKNNVMDILKEQKLAA